ncbi:hypothetical protein BH18THE2_BH18THE2_17290 [soil metagenome]
MPSLLSRVTHVINTNFAQVSEALEASSCNFKLNANCELLRLVGPVGFEASVRVPFLLGFMSELHFE